MCATHPVGMAYAQTRSQPENAIVRVNRETGGHCTGFAIDRRTVATAAHCLWLPRPRNWIRPTSLHVLAGYDRGDYRQHLRVARYRISADFLPDVGPLAPDQGGDWALLTLDKPFDGAPMPLAKAPPDRRTALSLAGFSGARSHRLTRHAPCRAVQFDGLRFSHDCPAGRGHSGAPVFAWSNGVRVAFGLHSASNAKRGLAVAAAAIRDGRSRQPY